MLNLIISCRRVISGKFLQPPHLILATDNITLAISMQGSYCKHELICVGKKLYLNF